MSEPDEDKANPSAEPPASLSESAARRRLARAKWDQSLEQARHRFAPENLLDEAIERTVDVIGDAADKGASLAWAHRGKIAMVAVLGGVVGFRKQISQKARPLATSASARFASWRARCKTD